MYKAFGIVNSSSRNIRVEGLEDYRPIGAFSFLGRYRMVDFPISNLSNSGIDLHSGLRERETKNSGFSYRHRTSL